MKVLVIGATGTYAGLVVPALVARGVDVRALVHDPDKADAARAAGAQEIVRGDLRDRASLGEAVRAPTVYFSSPRRSPPTPAS